MDALVNANRHFEFFWFPYAENVICKSLNETTDAAPAPRSSEEMYRRGEKAGTDSRVFTLINDVLPYAPFLLKPAHRLFSDLMPGPGRVRWSHELFPSPRVVRFNEMEYAVPYERAKDCLGEIVETIRKKRINTGFPDRIPHGGRGRCLAEPLLSPRQRHNCRASIPQGRHDGVVQHLRSDFPEL